jgi:hypothetical protein
VWFPHSNQHVTGEVVVAQPPADIAVLRLDNDVGVPPALLAPFSLVDVRRNRLPPDLTAVGFPDGYEETSQPVLFRPMDGVRQPGGPIQVRQVAGTETSLRPGFSGAAACLPTGRVVGMVTKADRSTGYGMIMPLDAIAHHWPQLENLVPLGSLFGVAAYRELRLIIGGLELPDRPESLLSESLNSRRDPSNASDLFLPTPLSAIEYIATEMSRPASEICLMIFEFLYLIARKAPQTVPALKQWIADHLWPDGPPPDTSHVEHAVEDIGGSMVVRLARSGMGDMYEVTLFHLDRSGTLRSTVECGRTMPAEIQDRVEDKLAEIFQSVVQEHYPRYFVEFAVPPSWRTEPFDEWSARYDDDVPLGWANPVVIRDLSKFDEGSQVLEKHWATLLNAGEVPLAWRDCRDPRDLRPFQAWLRRSPAPLVIGLAGLPVEPLLGKAAEHNVPVVLWTRDTCEDHPNGAVVASCRGLDFRAAVAAALAGKAIDSVPELVRQMRLDAGQSADPGQCGRSIALFWDDPRRRPADMGFRLGA